MKFFVLGCFRMSIAVTVFLIGAGTAVSQARDGKRILNAAFLAIDGVYNSELMAPFDIFHHSIFRDSSAYIRPFIVAPDADPFMTFEGLTILPHYSFASSPEVDILVIPSTANSMSLDLENEPYMTWLRQNAETASYVITVCDGAFALAATGLLSGRFATTFPGDRERFAAMFPDIEVLFDVSFAVDGKFITSVGGALSYEPALYLLERLYSKKHAELTAQGMALDWDLSRVLHFIKDSTGHRAE